MIAVINGWDFLVEKKVNLAETKEIFYLFVFYIEREGELVDFHSKVCQKKIVE